MKYYFNENAFLQEDIGYSLEDLLKSFKDLKDTITKENGKMGIKASFQFYELANRLRGSAAHLAGNLFREFNTCEKISLETGEADGFETKVTPNVFNTTVRDTLYLCARDEKEKMVSLPQDLDAVVGNYEIQDSPIATVYNLRTTQEIVSFNLLNPSPRSIKEVFDRIAEKCPYIEFHRDAYKSAKSRENSYKTIGYDEILVVLNTIHEEMLPFYQGNCTGVSEKGMFERLKRIHNIEVSVESDQTMKIYGYEREVTIDGTKYRMTNHIKLNKDACRMYFMYIEKKSKIYFGHCGKHLHTVSG